MKWPANWPHPLIIFVIVAWGVNFPMVKLAGQEFTAPSISLLRYAWTVPTMFALCLAMRRPLSLPRKYWVSAGVGGFVGSGVYMILFLVGMAKTSASQGAVALATIPIWVALLSALVGHEKITARMLGGSVLAFFGVAVAILGSQGAGSGNLLGTLLCLIAAFVWGISIILLRKAVNELDPFVAFAWSLPSAALVMIPFGWHDVAVINWGLITWRGWTGLLYTTFVSGVLGFTAYYKAVPIVGAARTAMVAYFIPIVAAIVAWPLLGNPLSLMHFVGLAIVLAGVALVSFKGQPVLEPVASGTIES